MSAAFSAVGDGTEFAGVEGSLRLLRHVAMVTQCVPDLDPVVAAWTRYLAYQVVERGELKDELCAAWNAPPRCTSAPCLRTTARNSPTACSAATCRGVRTRSAV